MVVGTGLEFCIADTDTFALNHVDQEKMLKNVVLPFSWLILIMVKI